MNKKYDEITLKKWIIIESVILTVLLVSLGLFWGFMYRYFYHPTLLLQETSPNGDYELTIYEIGSPRALTSDMLKVSLGEHSSTDNAYSYHTSFTIDVPTDGAHASFDIVWEEEGVSIVFHGKGNLYYFLPYEPEVSEDS